ncbi:MAG: hypothetical protein Ct9H90mP8_1160 [Pseudomonadota bacterium]|nr:MAG: hypothetical protein Ct9H90mP8_1160 [Pseudomonadota bacterium]
MKELISAEDRLSPLQQKLAKLGKQIPKFLAISGQHFLPWLTCPIMYFLIHGGLCRTWKFYNLFSTTSWSDYLPSGDCHFLAIIIIVVAVPEGSPMMIAVVLSLNMRKLLKQSVGGENYLESKPPEPLNILFSDKTGTLTEGRFPGCCSADWR